jgi:uncharacterized membrane protein
VADTNIPTLNLPDHTEETIRSIAQLRAEHHEKATRLERALDQMTALISRPWFIGVITVIVIGWIGLNLGSATLGLRPIDPPPFSWLEGAVSLGSLYMVVMILATQRREDQLAQHREMLILEVTLLSEQKIAKVIQLLEDRRAARPTSRLPRSCLCQLGPPAQSGARSGAVSALPPARRVGCGHPRAPRGLHLCASQTTACRRVAHSLPAGGRRESVSHRAPYARARASR